jgi:hypothetical protein
LITKGYAPKTIDHIHDVLSAVLRSAVKWGHVKDNPAHGVELPKVTTVRPKWALTTEQAALLLQALPPLAKTMVAWSCYPGSDAWSCLRAVEDCQRAGPVPDDS